MRPLPLRIAKDMTAGEYQGFAFASVDDRTAADRATAVVVDVNAHRRGRGVARPVPDRCAISRRLPPAGEAAACGERPPADRRRATAEARRGHLRSDCRRVETVRQVVRSSSHRRCGRLLVRRGAARSTAHLAHRIAAPAPGSRSISTCRTWKPCCCRRWTVGSICRHGPHQLAVKSSRTASPFAGIPVAGAAPARSTTTPPAKSPSRIPPWIQVPPARRGIHAAALGACDADESFCRKIFARRAVRREGRRMMPRLARDDKSNPRQQQCRRDASPSRKADARVVVQNAYWNRVPTMFASPFRPLRSRKRVVVVEHYSTPHA